MALYLDLQPSPQFDESLVRYSIINFNRIQALLRSGRKRIQVQHAQANGPWSQTIQLTAPWKCDVELRVSISWYCTAVQLSGIVLYWDGAALPEWPIMFFNEANSHKELATMNTIRNVAKGAHNITESWGAGAPNNSDSGDRMKVLATFYEL